jgi:5,10-methenyltetrahydrofolate synthetase
MQMQAWVPESGIRMRVACVRIQESMTVMAQSKDEMRTWAKRVERASKSDIVVGHLLAWPPLHGLVVTYLAMPSEVDLSRLNAHTRCRLLAPRIDAEDELALHVHDEASVERHAMGFDEPVETSEVVDPHDVDVVLVPGLAFDRDGGRLGRGMGYYDRLLARLPKGVTVVGITVDDAVVDAVPMDESDRSVGWLATESGIDRCGPVLQGSTQRVVERAIVRGVAASPIRFPEGTKTSADAAAAVNCDLGAIAKSLVFLVDDEPVLVICSGDRRVDELALASHFGGSVAHPAPLDRVRAESGFAAGGTPGIGIESDMPVVIDADLARYRWVWTAAGTPDTVYPISLERLVAASGARWVSVATKG